MVYSLLQWPRMQREAEALGFQVKAWRDPRVPEAEWLGALGAAGWSGAPEPLPRDCLVQWLPMEHFPVIRVLRRDQMHNWPIWGVMPTQAWQASLLNRKAALSGALALAGIP